MLVYISMGAFFITAAHTIRKSIALRIPTKQE